MTKRFRALTHSFSTLLSAIGAIGILIMPLLIGWQVFGRYVLNASPAWTEQLTLVLMVWLVMFTAAAGVREEIHIRIEVFVELLPPALQSFTRIASVIIVGMCGLVLAICGGQLVVAVWDHVIPTLGLPRGIAYLPLPLSGVLISIFALEKLLFLIQQPADTTLQDNS